MAEVRRGCGARQLVRRAPAAPEAPWRGSGEARSAAPWLAAAVGCGAAATVQPLRAAGRGGASCGAGEQGR